MASLKLIAPGRPGRDLLAFDPRNPLRDVDWRWGRAGYLIDAKLKLSRRRDDRWVRQAYAFRRALLTCVESYDFQMLALDFPHLYWAWQLHAHREDEHRMHTHALEARLLADQDWGEVAERSGIDRAVVEAYHEVFFAVKPHLKATDYLMFKVLRDAVYRGLRERQYDVLWKLFALWGGPHVVDVLISTFVNPNRPTEAAAVAGFIQDAVRGSLASKAMVAVKAINASGEMTGPMIVELYLKQCEIEKKAGGSGGQESILGNLGKVLTSLPFAAGGRQPALPDGRAAAQDAALKVYDDSAIELRGDEVLMLAAGADAPAAAAALDDDDDGFPPPPRKVANEA